MSALDEGPCTDCEYNFQRELCYDCPYYSQACTENCLILKGTKND